MFKSILRWLFRVKPAPAPAEKPPMAVRNKPKAKKVAGWPIAEAPFVAICARQMEAIRRVSLDVQLAGEEAKRRQAQAALVAEEPLEIEKWADRFKNGLSPCTCDSCVCRRALVNTGPHGVVSAGMAADRRLTSMEQAQKQQAKANRHITGHSVPGILD